MTKADKTKRLFLMKMRALLMIDDVLDGIDEDFADKLNFFILNDFKLTDRTDYFSCGYPQEVLQLCELDEETEIVITQDGMRKILGQKKGKQDDAHDLTPIETLRLPQLLREPILVINGNTSDSRLVFIEIPRAGRKVFAVISVNKYLHLKENRIYNLVATTYSSEDKKISEKIRMACAKNEVWYYDSRKIKNWLSAVGELQLFSNLKTNSMYSDKDVWNNDANIEKNQTDQEKNEPATNEHNTDNPAADIVNRYLALLDKPTHAAAMGVLSSVERFIEQSDNNYPYMTEFAAMAVSLSNYVNEETATPQIAAVDLNNLHKVTGVKVDNSELKGIVSSKTLLAHQFEPLNFGGKWKLLFGRPTAPFKVMVHGAPGNGKSTFAIQFAKYLASSHKLRVLYIANEESFTYTFQEKLMRLNAIDDNLKIADSLPDNFDDYDVAFFDSVNTMKLDIDDLRRIFKQNDKTSFVLIFQNNKKGQFRGSLEYEHEFDVTITVDNMKAVAGKNRFGGKEEINVLD